MIDRRTFLGATAAGAASLLLRQSSRPAPSIREISLGATGRSVPRLGLGCFPLGNLPKEDDGVAVVRHALRHGVRYLDTAPSYNSGESERRVGAAISGTKRAELFIATKTLERRADGARRELEASLRRLGVEYVDCVQVHEVHDDWESLFSKDSVLDGLARAKEEKLVRHIGITCHRDPRYVRSACERYEFATALVPVNPADPQHLSFVRDFLPFAAEKRIAVVAMKIFGGGRLVTDKLLSARECLQYAWAQKHATVLVPGAASIAEFDDALTVAQEDKSVDAAWLAAVEAKVGAHRGKDTEWYKNSKP